MTIMALDVGEKTIGVAFSDETGTIAFPGETILRQEGKKRDMAALRQRVADRQVREIVVGLPLMMDGTRGIQVEKVEEFIAVLRNNVRIPIHRQDERLSTSEADRILIAGGRRRDQRKQDIDSLAATLILQTFLDRRRAISDTVAVPLAPPAPSEPLEPLEPSEPSETVETAETVEETATDDVGGAA